MPEILGTGQDDHRRPDRSRFVAMLGPELADRARLVDALDPDDPGHRARLAAMRRDEDPPPNPPPARPSRSKITREDAEAAALLAETATVYEVAAAAGVTPNTITRAWTMYGIERPARSRPGHWPWARREAEVIERTTKAPGRQPRSHVDGSVNGSSSATSATASARP